MAFTRQDPFSKKVTDLPDKPTSAGYSASDVKTYIETPDDENKSFVDGLICELESTIDGASGADNVGATGFDGVASTIQALLEYLNTNKATKGADWTGTWQGYTPSKADPGISSVVEQHTAQLAETVQVVNVMNPKYGCKGDGVTDDTQGILNAIGDLNSSGKKTLVFPSGYSFYVSSPLIFNVEGINIIGYGANILSHVANGANTFEFDGNIGNDISITADIPSGTTTFKVSTADSANFAVGDYVLIKTNEAYVTLSDATLAYKKGEIVKVSAVDTTTGTITIDGVSIELSYTMSGNNLRCDIITPLNDISVEGLRFIGSNTNDGQNAIWFQYCKDIRVRNVEMSKFTTGITFSGCIHGEVTGSYIFDNNNSTTGYGIQCSTSSKNINVHHNRFENNRHCFTITSYVGVCMYLNIDHNIINKNMMGYSLDTHDNGRHIVFDGNIINNSYGGIAFRTPYTTVINNKISRVSNNAIYGYDMGGINCNIKGNEITNSLKDGINVGISTGSSGYELNNFVDISDNTIINLSSGTGISVSSSPIMCVVNKNKIYYYGYIAINITGADQLQISDNLIQRGARSTYNAIIANANTTLTYNDANGSHASITENSLVSAGTNISVTGFSKLRLSGNMLDGTTKYTLSSIGAIIGDELLRSPDGTLYKLSAANGGTISGVAAY